MRSQITHVDQRVHRINARPKNQFIFEHALIKRFTYARKVAGLSLLMPSDAGSVFMSLSMLRSESNSLSVGSSSSLNS